MIQYKVHYVICLYCLYTILNICMYNLSCSTCQYYIPYKKYLYKTIWTVLIKSIPELFTHIISDLAYYGISYIITKPLLYTKLPTIYINTPSCVTVQKTAPFTLLKKHLNNYKKNRVHLVSQTISTINSNIF